MSRAAMVDIPEAALAAADHVLGDAQTKLTLLEYGDYECPACIQAEPLMQHLVDAHRGRPRFIFKHFPLVEIHPNAELAAEAAAAQGQFWPMHHLLFAQADHLTPAALTGYAQSLGLDMNRFNAEMIGRRPSVVPSPFIGSAFGGNRDAATGRAASTLRGAGIDEPWGVR